VSKEQSDVVVFEAHGGQEAGRVLSLVPTDSNLLEFEDVLKALGSDKRLAILQYLGAHTSSVLEIADALGWPPSTVTLHVNVLEHAGLIRTEIRPASRGLQKVCARSYDRVTIQLSQEREDEPWLETAMPLGAYVDARVSAPCGLLSAGGMIGALDDPTAFFEPERLSAQMLWFHKGYVEYRFPNRLRAAAMPDALELSFEACSEAPLHRGDWPSDITVWINGVRIGTWTSPADFGGQRGVLTPDWWGEENSQYGLLKVWRITSSGSYLDDVQVSEVALDALRLGGAATISVRIGVPDGALNVGGINLFGSKFGNHPQDLLLRYRYQEV
jgi:predicted transcriptional regulator